MEDRAPSTPSRGLLVFAAAVSLVYAGALAFSADRASCFNGDDVMVFWQARTLPFWTLLGTPIDVHVVPLHRLVTLVLARAAPLDTRLAITVMLALHLGSVVFLERTLRTATRSPSAAIVAAGYATFVYLGALFAWWTSALHRLPYVLCLGGSLYCYLRCRNTRRWPWAAGTAGFLVVALGFFEKAALIPVVLLGVEASLDAEPGERRRNVTLAAALLATSAVYFCAWHFVINPRFTAITHDVRYLFDFARVSWLVLLNASVGGNDVDLTLAAAVWIPLVTATCVLRPANARIWVIGVAVVTLTLVANGLSRDRAETWGLLGTWSHRYYPDSMYVLSIFVGLVVGRTRLPVPLHRTRFLGAAAAVIAGAALVALSIRSYRNGRATVESFADLRQTTVYLDNVREGVRALQARGVELRFVDGSVPRYVNIWGGPAASHRALLGALGVDARITRRRRGSFRITSSGHVEPATR